MPEVEFALFGSLEPHLQRFLPLELANAMRAEVDSATIGPATLEAFVHLAASRYTITTYLPRFLAQQLIVQRRPHPWLERTDGTLLFADLSGSTELADHLSALGREGIEQATAALNHIFGAMIEIVEAHGGDLLSFGGDALLVLFSGENHCHTAALAAQALLNALEASAYTIPNIGSISLQLHVGVECGLVACTSVGLDHTRHFGVLGTTVNQVAMAETLAGPGEVVLGPNAARALASATTSQPLPKGFVRLTHVAPLPQPYMPTADDLPIITEPHEAIPLLLDDLDHIRAHIAPGLLERILADPQRPQIEADLRPVTVLFSQIVGVEALAESLPVAEAAALLHDFIAGMQASIEQFGGVVNKLDIAEEGMKLVAIFGAPIAYEDHAERAALAALDMQERFAHQAASRQPKAQTASDADHSPSTQFQQRIGLNLGTVFAGNVGNPSRKEYTVMGDAVNVAARVMGKARWGEIWCSAAVADVVWARLICEDCGKVSLKGKPKPASLFRIAARREIADKPRTVAPSPLIGREREQAWLHEQLAAASRASGGVVRISGEAGVGKSRLSAVLAEDARAAGFQVISARCFSYTAGIPYAAWGVWLRSNCGITTSDNVEHRTRALAERLAELGPEMNEWLPVLSDLVLVDMPENRLTRGLDPRMRQTRRFELIEQLLLHAAAINPVLVLFEDLHWADPISLELWERIAARIANHAVLLLGTHRSRLEADDHAALLHLRELSAEESRLLAASLPGAANLPTPVLKQIISRAAGNPLFLSELIHTVVNTHQPSTGHHAAIAELPSGLNGLLLARIDKLDETSRNVLRVASVIGQRIPFGVLRSLQPSDQEALVRQLLQLDQQEFTALERTEPERIHVFRHALVQEVAYQSMLYARRRELHGRIGAYLERRYADSLDDYTGLIAHHYRLSDQREKAVAFLLKAGRAASAVYANEEAIQSYQWAIDILGDTDAQALEAHDALGDVFATIGRYDDALRQHGAVLIAAKPAQEAMQRAHRKRGAVLEKQGEYAAALVELEQAMAIAQSGTLGLWPFAIPAICAEIALVYKRQGQYDRAIAACDQGLQALHPDDRTYEDEQIEARLHSELGGIYGMRGDYPRAREHFERSMHIRDQIDDLPGLAAVHNNLGYLWQLQSEYERAIEQYQLAEQHARKIGLQFVLIFAELNTAYALINLGEYTNARARCLDALQFANDMQDRRNIAQAYDTLGLIAYQQGEYALSEQYYRDELDIQRSMNSYYGEGNTLIHLSFVFNAQNKPDQARQFAEQAVFIAQSLKSERLIAEGLNSLAEALLASNEFDLAKQSAENSLQISQSIQSHYDTGIALRTLGLIHALQNHAFDQHLTESLALFQRSKNKFEEGRAHAALYRALQATGRFAEAEQHQKQATATFMQIGAHGELVHLED